MIKLITGQFALKKDDVFSITETLTHDNYESRIMIVLDIQGKKAKSIFENIKKIFEENFFDDTQDLLFKFEESMKKVNEYLKEIKECKFSGIIAAQERKEIHISQAGQGEAYLIRRGKLNVIIENIGSEKSDDEVFTSIASGELLIDDRIILSTVRVLRYATASQIVGVLSEGISEGLEALKELLEIEAGEGSVICFHSRGESVFTSADKSAINIPHHMRSSFFVKIIGWFDMIVDSIAKKTGKSVEIIRNTIFALLSVFFIIILIWGVSSASIDNIEKEKYEAYKIQILKVEKELQTAETRSLMSDFASSNAILDKVESTVKNMISEGVFVDESLVILERIQQQRDTTNKISRIKNLKDRVLADISSVDKNEKVKGIVVLNKEIYAYTEKSLYKSVLDHIDPKIIVTEDSKILRAEAIDDRNLILFTLVSGAMVKYEGGKVSPAKTTDEAGFKKAISEKSYGRYVYFLSKDENKIWKYENKREGFTTPTSWLTEDVTFENALDMAIDGSIYVLFKEGNIELYHKGKKIALNIKGNTNYLTGTTKIFVKPDMLNVYLLNTKRNSILKYEIINEGLEYKQEYLFESESPILDFYVDQNEQRMVISDNAKVYEITL